MYSPLITHSSLPTTLIKTHVSLAEKTWFKAGGCAQFYAEPTTPEEVAVCIRWAHEQQIPLFVLGEGANILISDEGFPGLVLRLQLNTLSHTTHTVTAGAGVSIAGLITYCLQNNLIGLEEFSGIPGTVGGSVYINLHYFEFLLSDFLLSATVIHKETGLISIVEPSWFKFGYNQSTLQTDPYILLDATLQVKQVDALEVAYARGRSTEIIRHRLKRYPAQGTCGSFFRNFYDHEVTLESHGKKIIFVAYYLDKIGVKGALSVGDAIVSYQHANMLVNRGTASATDIITLARLMQEKVRDHFGIIPQPECQLIGFQKYPLL